ncbi:HAMP domain-containing sensor histidine kinase [Vibrio rhizosphaerae]|uniref:histidine kinase n=1 Tax=Vibrio rhizosphaerae TaxID=398736 RepID=A0ABU4IWV2_9VIBR|nr:HAMP domain-containing sensor histidine kinase [Vibrio rhizosphaerae]MDW6093885.1 HAMP domain-containing sensor histidine kinase [Vibrio rhizosphaerae]
MKLTHEGKLSLWGWISSRIISLTIGTVVLIAVCMWLRFALWNLWVFYDMPAPVRAEFSLLQQNPESNWERYVTLVEQYYGHGVVNTSVATMDWLILLLLVLLTIPIIIWLGLRGIRPLARQFMSLARTARHVAKGDFTVQCQEIEQIPSELSRFVYDFNQMTRQLEQYEAKLKRSNVAMAHELRSPVTSAMGRLQGIMDGVFDPSTEHLEQIMRQLNSLNVLIHDLHLLSLAQAGQLSISRQPTNLSALIQERMAWLAPHATEKSMTFTLDAPETVMCNVDPERIGQVCLILMENALRYAAEGKMLTMTVRDSAEQVQIQFIDQGPGVSADYVDNMFEPFSREEVSRNRRSGGSGLGLSIAKAICQAHQGDIQVTLAAGRGLCFDVILPKHVPV